MRLLRRVVLALVVAIAILMVLPAGIGSQTNATATLSPAHPAALPNALSASPSNAASGASSLVSSNPTEARVLADLRADHAPMSKVFLPNFNSQIVAHNDVISPLYSTAPAPMGLSDLGVQEEGGVNVGTISYTSSVKAAVTLNSVEPLYLDAAGPDQFGIQENTVLTHADVLGALNTDYWIQNVPVYYASSGLLVFEDNIWNFSNPALYFPSNGIYAHGPASFFVGNEVYVGVGLVSYDVAPPFTITTYNNATVFNDRPTVFFNYTLTKGSTSVSGSYDFAEFNSTGNVIPTQPAPEPTYQINGQAPDPTGYLLNDAEIVIGGPGGGSTTTLFNTTGSFGLWTLDNGSSAYTTVPSAYDFGTDTGETSEGIAEYSSGGANPVAEFHPGPSLLYPLWGIQGSVPAGADAQKLRITPSNAFVFIAPGASFNASAAAWAPVPTSGLTTYWLPPGKYTYRILLSEYQPETLAISGANSLRPVSLTYDRSMGVYTPLWAWGNGQLAAISQSGRGTMSNPYVLDNNQVSPIDPLFGEFNDFLFPVFPGIFLIGTTAHVSVWAAPSFYFNYAIQPELATVLGLGLPTTNYLEYDFYYATHVSIVNNPEITGWIFADDVGFTEASVVFWNSSNNLIAGNTFDVMSDALVLFGGTDNTIWGNVLTPVEPVAPNPTSIGMYGEQLGLTLYESKDLIYNNAFLTPFTAFTPTVNIYNGAAEQYQDHWNIPKQPASDRMAVNGWILEGSIIGTDWQGGNFWQDYGTFINPYGVLPYDEGGLISYHGDYVPLIPFRLYTLTFTETGLPHGTSWSVTLNGVTFTTTGKSIKFYDPNGAYRYTLFSPSIYTAHPASGTATVHNGNLSMTIHWT
ncbi:MAG: thermopsin family protease [Thermoplasmata archaeon]